MGTYYALMQRIHDVVKRLESTGELDRIYSGKTKEAKKATDPLKPEEE